MSGFFVFGFVETLHCNVCYGYYALIILRYVLNIFHDEYLVIVMHF